VAALFLLELFLPRVLSSCRPVWLKPLATVYAAPFEADIIGGLVLISFFLVVVLLSNGFVQGTNAAVVIYGN
jgi:hypothetical protein